jgi:hypothetical protein
VKATDVRSFREQRSQWEAPPVQRGTTGVPRPETRPAPRTEAASRPTRGVGPPAVVPPRQVRVTQPERVAVPNLPRTPQPAESRFIPKQPPIHPAQEQHVAPAPNPQSSKGPPNRDRPR